MMDGEQCGSYCEIALLEADGECKVLATTSRKRSVSVGRPFFRGVGATPEETRFALEHLKRSAARQVVISSECGAIWLSGYFYSSVRLLFAVILKIPAKSVFRVVSHSFPDVCVSPDALASAGALCESDEKAFPKLQALRVLLGECFPPVGTAGSLDRAEAIRLFRRTASAAAELTGRNFLSDLRGAGGSRPVFYDPRMGALAVLAYFCYASRVDGKGTVVFTVGDPEEENSMMLAGAPEGRSCPELVAISELDRYGRQRMDFLVLNGAPVLRLPLERERDPEELLRVKTKSAWKDAPPETEAVCLISFHPDP